MIRSSRTTQLFFNIARLCRVAARIASYLFVYAFNMRITYCLFAGRVSHFPERLNYITALVGAVARLRVCLYTSLCWHCVLFVSSIFYQLVPIRICLPSSSTLPSIGGHLTGRWLLPHSLFFGLLILDWCPYLISFFISANSLRMETRFHIHS